MVDARRSSIPPTPTHTLDSFLSSVGPGSFTITAAVLGSSYDNRQPRRSGNTRRGGAQAHTTPTPQIIPFVEEARSTTSALVTNVVLLDELDLIVTERSYYSWAAVAGSTTAAAAAAGKHVLLDALLDSVSLLAHQPRKSGRTHKRG